MTAGGGPHGPGTAPARAEPGSEARRPLGMPRDRRLKRQRLIRPLFDRTRSEIGRLSVGSIQLRWRMVPREAAGSNTPLQVGFTAGRRPRTKVARNHLRRVMRETWRVSQAPLLHSLGARSDSTLTVFALFRGSEEHGPDEIRRDLPRALSQLTDHLDTVHASHA